MSLINKLKKNSTIQSTDILTESKILLEKDVIPTTVPAINIALSGSINGGLTPGLTVFAGKSKHFKSNFCLLLAEAYLRKYDDSVLLFYDCEFGSPISYFKSMGINPERVLHCPIATVEDLKHDISVQLKNIERGDKVIIILDSLGNLASAKETEDAIDGKAVADMSRAKAVKSLFRIITAQLSIKNIPMLVIAHTYDSMCLAGDTLIKTEKGNIPIKDITIGDIVYTNNGMKKISHTYTPNDLNTRDKLFLELKFDDGSKIKCTHDHKFLMKTGEWIKAIDIKIGEVFY